MKNKRVNRLGLGAGKEVEKLRDCVVMKKHSEA